MNADDIFKRYILKEKPKTLRGFDASIIVADDVIALPKLMQDPRGSGRTTRAIAKLTPNSIFVCSSDTVARFIKMSAESRMDIKDIEFVGLSRFIDGSKARDRRVSSGEIVGFDHTFYEAITSADEIGKFNRACILYSLAGYKIELDNDCWNYLIKKNKQKTNYDLTA